MRTVTLDLSFSLALEECLLLDWIVSTPHIGELNIEQHLIHCSALIVSENGLSEFSEVEDVARGALRRRRHIEVTTELDDMIIVRCIWLTMLPSTSKLHSLQLSNVTSLSLLLSTMAALVPASI